jgi:energy-coupling factor transporter ATP-binding protein EcfA2
LEDIVPEMRDEFSVTVLFITHDMDESVFLSSRVVVLTSPPTRVREVVEILAVPRDQVETKDMWGHPGRRSSVGPASHSPGLHTTNQPFRRRLGRGEGRGPWVTMRKGSTARRTVLAGSGTQILLHPAQLSRVRHTVSRMQWSSG